MEKSQHVLYWACFSSSDITVYVVLAHSRQQTRLPPVTSEGGVLDLQCCDHHGDWCMGDMGDGQSE